MKTFHPHLDGHLRRMPMRLAAEWGMRLHMRCACGRSVEPHVTLVLDARPDLAHLRVCDAAERMICQQCRKRYEMVLLLDHAPNGLRDQEWEVTVLDRNAGRRGALA